MLINRESNGRSDGSAVTIEFDPSASEGPPRQLGYMVAPRLLATCWHPAFLPFVGKRQGPANKPPSLRVNGNPKPNQILFAWANSRADCAVIELADPVSDGRVVRLGTIWDGGSQGVLHWTRRTPTEDRPLQPLVNHPATINVSYVGHHQDTQQAFLLLRTDVHLEGTEETRGSPVILNHRDLCLGHVLGPAASTAYEVCPAFSLHQLAPFSIPYRNWFSHIQRPYVEQLIAALGDDIVVWVLCMSDDDFTDLEQMAVSMHRNRAGDLPGLRLQRVKHLDKTLQLSRDSMLLVILDEPLEGTTAFRDLLDKVFVPHPKMVYASVLADAGTRHLSSVFHSSGYQLSAERPLHWIFDRRQRLAAWSSVLQSLRLQLAMSRKSHRERMLEHGA